MKLKLILGCLTLALFAADSQAFGRRRCGGCQQRPAAPVTVVRTTACQFPQPAAPVQQASYQPIPAQQLQVPPVLTGAVANTVRFGVGQLQQCVNGMCPKQ